MPPRVADHRRAVLMGLGGLGAAGLAGCVTPGPVGAGPGGSAGRATRPRIVAPTLAPLIMRAERITRITVCTRPFRAAGPRLEVERIGSKRVVHNYGHGGSGWSLSWGSAAIAAGYALEDGTRDIAVIGCGALGITTALTLLRAGARVTIYAAERLPETRSARASGVWTPDSRVADSTRVDAAFAALWERMARISWARHQTYVGLPGEPVAFHDRYILADPPRTPRRPAGENEIAFAEYGDRLNDIVPHSRLLAAAESPFPTATARLDVQMQFNIAELTHRLIRDVLIEGGRIQSRVFHAPSELADLSQPVIVNCTGYGARALFGDESLVPVRGQLAWLPPQPEARYGLYYNGVAIVSRPDGVGVQKMMSGYGDADETPDRAEAEGSVAKIAALFDRAMTPVDPARRPAPA